MIGLQGTRSAPCGQRLS